MDLGWVHIIVMLVVTAVVIYFDDIQMHKGKMK